MHGDAEPLGNLSCGWALVEAVDVSKQRDQVATFGIGVGEVRPFARPPIHFEGAKRPIVAGRVQGNIFVAFEPAAGQPLGQQRPGARQGGGGDSLEVYGRVARVRAVVRQHHLARVGQGQKRAPATNKWFLAGIMAFRGGSYSATISAAHRQSLVA